MSLERAKCEFSVGVLCCGFAERTGYQFGAFGGEKIAQAFPATSFSLLLTFFVVPVVEFELPVLNIAVTRCKHRLSWTASLASRIVSDHFCIRLYYVAG